MKKNRRPQAQKPRNIDYMRGMQEIRKSGAAGPHTSKKAYVRKPKHQEW